MRNKIIISVVAISLFVGGAFFVWKEKFQVIKFLQDSEERKGTSLVKAKTYTPPVVTWEEMQKIVNLSGDFSKDESAAYWHSTKIIEADVASFGAYDKQYAYDKNKVYYGALGPAEESIFVIQGADVATFTSLGNGYAKDKNYVYFKGEAIVGADSGTFELQGLVNTTLYAKDKYQVYFQNEIIEGFDAPTFRILEKSRLFSVFMADKNKVAMGGLSEEQSVDGRYKFEVHTIDGADPSSFVVLDELWGKDTKQVFYGTQAVREADPETFQVLGADDSDYHKMLYAKDKDYVYYFGKRVDDADAASFRIVEDVTLSTGNFGEDMHSAYKDGGAFPKQDLRSLEKGKIPSSAKNLGSNYYLYRDNVYHYSPPAQAGAYFGLLYAQQQYVPEEILADPATFQVLKDGYARDKEYIYWLGSKLADDPDESFIILKSSYSKTNKAVFLNNNAIEGALPDSFQILSLGYAKDAQSVFYGDRKVNEADPASFEVLGRGLSSEEDDWAGGLFYYNYARDVSGIFCEASKLTIADPKTFTLKGENGMPQDKLHHYDGCETRE